MLITVYHPPFVQRFLRLEIHRNGRSIRVLFKETIGDVSSLIQKNYCEIIRNLCIKKRGLPHPIKGRVQKHYFFQSCFKNSYKDFPLAQ